MLKLLTKINQLKGKWITFTELKQLENKYEEEISQLTKLCKQYLDRYNDEDRANSYLRRDYLLLNKQYTLLKVIFWICLIGNNILWYVVVKG